jgi:hypothetical protein
MVILFSIFQIVKKARSAFLNVTSVKSEQAKGLEAF